MLIGIDGNEANIENRVGVNQYAYEILHGLYRLQDSLKSPNQYIVYLKNKPSTNLPKENKYWEYKVLPGKGMWIIKTLTPYLLFTRQKPAIFFSPSHYLPPISTIPQVCSIMDLGYLEFSEQFKKYDYWQLRLWSAWSIKISKYLISISEATKKDITTRYPFSYRKVKTTLLAYDKKQFNTHVSRERINKVTKRYSIEKYY